uniref:Major facilitator superfamily (MFS) profile domain-containing protein n=2 Tax=Glycine subgen. Soja TaxID=1462606 RepID=A0A0R0HD99_SOYBN
MERADENLLHLSTKKNFVQVLSSPLVGILVINYDHPTILAMGTFCWALSTAAVGVCHDFLQVAFWRAINGFGLAIVIPALQSFIADSYKDGVRGTGFGLLSLIGNLGGIGGGVLATVMAGQQFWGIQGWRCPFILMATLSALIGFLVLLYVVDSRKRFPTTPDASESSDRGDSIYKGNASATSVWMDSWAATKAVIKVKTFQIIGLQVIIGSLPWTAMVFFTMWFELIGFDNNTSATLLSLFAIGCAMGSFSVGSIADKLSQVYPHSARTMCAQFSAFMGIPFSWFLLR